MTDQNDATADETERTRIGHCKADETDVYVGRGPGGRDMTETPVGERGWLGNPYTIEEYHREGAIEKFREDFEDRLKSDPEFRAAVRDLAGKTLGCWCQRLDDDVPKCHAEVIAEYADRLAHPYADGGIDIEPSDTERSGGDDDG